MGAGHPWGGMHSSALDVARLLQVTKPSLLRFPVEAEQHSWGINVSAPLGIEITAVGLGRRPCWRAARGFGASPRCGPRRLTRTDTCRAGRGAWAGRCEAMSFECWLACWLLATFRRPSACDSWLSACVLGGSQTTPSYGSDGGLIRPGKITCQLGDLLSSASFGHTGSVGSVAWCDPVTEMVCVICSVRSVRTGEEPTICGACCYAADSFVGSWVGRQHAVMGCRDAMRA